MKFNDKDFKVVYTKGSGPGGQHRNKVETACTITHIPTGMTQSCQSTRSKLKNYELALKTLKSKLVALEEAKKHESLNKLRADAVFDDSTGSLVIRTYNYKRNEVKDHRTGKKANLQVVLDGKIDLIK
jgi:protein subunit release factor A